MCSCSLGSFLIHILMGIRASAGKCQLKTATKKNVCLLLIKTEKKTLLAVKATETTFFFFLQTFYINSKVSLCQECQEMAARICLKWLR